MERSLKSEDDCTFIVHGCWLHQFLTVFIGNNVDELESKWPRKYVLSIGDDPDRLIGNDKQGPAEFSREYGLLPSNGSTMTYKVTGEQK